MPPYDIIDFVSDDDQKLILVDDYEATTNDVDVTTVNNDVEHVTDLTNAVVEYTPFTFTAPSMIINTLQMIDDGQYNDDEFILSLMDAAERLYGDHFYDETKYQDELERMMTAANNHDAFEVNIDNNIETQHAFIQVLRYIRDNRSRFPTCLLYTSPSPRDPKTSRMPSSA